MSAAAPFVVGAVLALVVAAVGKFAGLDRERSFYSTILIVVGSYYVLFAAIGAGPPILGMEVIGLFFFGTVAVIGFQRSLWLVVGGLAGHGALDAVRRYVVANPGVPNWWPAFCGTFDVTAALCLAAVLISRGEPQIPRHA